MTPEEQQVVIAEACGWTEIRDYVYSDDGALKKGGRREGMVKGWEHIPDYLNDLNAMHEAEKTLSKEEDRALRSRTQFNLYVWHLYKVCTGHDWETDVNDYPGDVMCATAAQRAEAFLRTIGKWYEGIKS